MADREILREKFNKLFSEWLRAISDPRIASSSRPQDYTQNKPYREIIALGRDALPLIVEKLEHGVFLLNEAALAVAGRDLAQLIELEKAQPSRERVVDVVKKPMVLLSEQEKSRLILRHCRGG